MQARALFAGVFTAAALGACEAETRVVKYDPILGGLPGSTTGEPVVRDRGEYVDPTIVADDKIVLEDDQGNRTLVAKTGRHLMTHIYNALMDDDKQLFVEQILSQKTKQEYFDRGLDPGLAFDALVKRRNDVFRLFDAMPGGEYTPGVYKRPVGEGVQRVEVTGVPARGLKWTAMDMVMERGNWRLRWFAAPKK
jgi:hypothetical protein